MQNDPQAFPEARIRPAGTVSRRMCERGITTVRDAVGFVRALPYGRTEDRSDCLAVLDEGTGTCSTKHALLARLCSELGLSAVELTLGIYPMNERNTPGVGQVLEAYGLAFLPEAHCYLRYEGDRFDFTRGDADGEVIEEFFGEEAIRPGQIGEYKTERHRAFLADWIERTDLELDLETVWRVRERCIERLSQPSP